MRERLANELETIPDVTHTVVSFIEQGDAFADEWTFVGTHTCPLTMRDGTVLSPTGKRWRSRVWRLCAWGRTGGRLQHALLRQPGCRSPARARPRGRDRVIELS